MSATEDLTNWKGCPPPAHEPIEGVYVRLVPLDIDKHGDELYSLTAANVSILQFLWDSPPKSKEEFFINLKSWTTRQDRMFFVVLNKKTLEVEAVACLQNINPIHGKVEIGPYYAYSKGMGKTVLKHEGALRVLEPLIKAGYRRCEYKIWTENTRSLKGAHRIGLIYEGTFRKNFVQKGKNRDDAWFSATDDDWPLLSHVLDEYTKAENVKGDYEEVRSLVEIREELIKLPQYKEFAERYAKTEDYFRSINII